MIPAVLMLAGIVATIVLAWIAKSIYEELRWRWLKHKGLR